MLNSYIEVIRESVALFPLIAVLFTIPYMLWCYHKYGSVLSIRIVIVYSFILYLMTVYFLVILPLPDIKEVQAAGPKPMLLDPFRVIYDIHKDLAAKSLIHSTALWEFLFNMVMLMPFGMYLHYYFGQSLLKTLLFSFGLSLFFELTQLSGLYGIYPYAYRFFDVDDLIANTVGGVAGWFLVVPLLEILPSRKSIDKVACSRARHVSRTRRLFAFGIDLFIASILFIWGPLAVSLYYLISVCVFSKTAGLAFVRLKISSPDGLKGLFLREMFALAGYVWPPEIMADLPAAIGTIGLCVWLVLIFAAFISWIFGRPPYFAKWSDTRIVNSVKVC